MRPISLASCTQVSVEYRRCSGTRTRPRCTMCSPSWTGTQVQVRAEDGDDQQVAVGGDRRWYGGIGTGRWLPGCSRMRR
jgi:hypothetical protein